ncbi:hypothetical protein SLS62_000723 [Diatrype stigma]|uniref:Thioester reductase (TE) domain-containing protein n=1 Tax=Diatrype stigma TaxID=117547 RepID=A0AAN9YWN8_9PEZI
MVPDATLLKTVMRHQELRALLLPPSLAEQLLLEPNGMDFFRKLDFLAYSGAPFHHTIGDQLSEVVELVSPFGSTETYPQPELAPIDRKDWPWHEFNPFVKHEMQLYDPDEGTYELVILADPSTKDTAAVFHNLPGVGQFRTKDLFTRHPTNLRLFKYYGRRDDIIVFSNGEKTNPIPLELSLQTHSALKGVLVIGNGRTQASLLVEPKEPLDVEGRASLIEGLWPDIQNANLLVAGQGRIYHGKVICALPDKPFRRTGKGTIVRRLTEADYEKEIEDIYTNDPSGGKAVTLIPAPKPFCEGTTMVKFLRDVLALSFPEANVISEHQDLTSHGLDSIQILEIVSNLKRSLRSQSTTVEWISPWTVFQNPTIDKLSQIFIEFVNKGVIPTKGSDLTLAHAINDAVAASLNRLPKMPTLPAAKPPGLLASNISTVAIIGSTGYFGSHIVAVLLRSPEVRRIYCLNRSRDAQQRQENSLRTIDENLVALLHKLEYIQVDFEEPFLGLPKHEYESFDFDVVVYNAWRLDFNRGLQSFNTFLRIASDIVSLSLAAKGNMRIVFVSSLASVANLAKDTTVPEAPIQDPQAAFKMGYGQSKLATELILVAANERYGIPVTIFRVCQLGGPTITHGGLKWADQPWISALARTAKAIKCVPTKVTAVDWLAVDVAANMICNLIHQPIRSKAQFYHICQPKPEPWQPVADILCQLLGVTDTLPLQDWITKLKSVADSGEGVAVMPALAMLDFLEELGDGTESLSYSTTRALEDSHVEVPPIDKSVLQGWFRSWDL